MNQNAGVKLTSGEAPARHRTSERGTTVTSLKELQSWGLARVAHTLGDRRDHFETDKDLCRYGLAVMKRDDRNEKTQGVSQWTIGKRKNSTST